MLHEGSNYKGYNPPPPLNTMYKHLESEVWGSPTFMAPHKALESQKYALPRQAILIQRTRIINESSRPHYHIDVTHP